MMHMAWPIPGVGIDDPEALYCPIFSAHAYLLGKKEHLMIVPRFENDPIKLAEPAFRKIYLETTPLQLPDGSPMPVAHELWIRLVSNSSRSMLPTVSDRVGNRFSVKTNDSKSLSLLLSGKHQILISKL